MGGDAPLQNNAAQAHASCATEHAHKADSAGTLRNQRLVQRKLPGHDQGADIILRLDRRAFPEAVDDVLAQLLASPPRIM